MAVCYSLRAITHPDTPTSIHDTSSPDSTERTDFLLFLILLNFILPVSLYVSIEVQVVFAMTLVLWCDNQAMTILLQKFRIICIMVSFYSKTERWEG